MTTFVKEDHIFFWGGIFSNFHPINGNEALTSEHFYMEAKAIFFSDFKTLVRIRQAATPKEAKRLGRSVERFDQAEWDKVKCKMMKTALANKLMLDDKFLQALKDSGNKILVEASPFDRIWGIGFKEDDPNICNTELWGENLLGKCLMEVREAMFAPQIL